MTIFQLSFWRGLGGVLLRTLIAGAAPFIGPLVKDFQGSVGLASSTVAMLLIATVLSSLRGTTDPENATWWQLLVSRSLRQGAQFAAAAVVTAVVLSDVNWYSLGQDTLISMLTTLGIAALQVLPSQAQPAEAYPDEGIEGLDGLDEAVVEGN